MYHMRKHSAIANIAAMTVKPRPLTSSFNVARALDSLFLMLDVMESVNT